VPAAAVIPAPIAYIKVVAVKKLVVGFTVGGLRGNVRAVSVRAIRGPSCLRSSNESIGTACASRHEREAIVFISRYLDVAIRSSFFSFRLLRTIDIVYI
jgi:hypothetical protein